jgi:hypothetical protein
MFFPLFFLSSPAPSCKFFFFPAAAAAAASACMNAGSPLSAGSEQQPPGEKKMKLFRVASKSR